MEFVLSIIIQILLGLIILLIFDVRVSEIGMFRFMSGWVIMMTFIPLIKPFVNYLLKACCG